MGAIAQGSATAEPQHQTSTCPTCGETIADQFCSACGERKHNRHNFSFRHFARHAAHELLEMDSKILRTVRYLFSRPGFVTAEYLAGKRSRYVTPLRLYVFCFALSTLLTPPAQSVWDFKNLININRTGWAKHALTQLANQKGVSEEVLLQHYERETPFV